MQDSCRLHAGFRETTDQVKIRTYRSDLQTGRSFCSRVSAKMSRLNHYGRFRRSVVKMAMMNNILEVQEGEKISTFRCSLSQEGGGLARELG